MNNIFNIVVTHVLKGSHLPVFYHRHPKTRGNHAEAKAKEHDRRVHFSLEACYVDGEVGPWLTDDHDGEVIGWVQHVQYGITDDTDGRRQGMYHRVIVHRSHIHRNILQQHNCDMSLKSNQIKCTLW